MKDIAMAQGSGKAQATPRERNAAARWAWRGACTLAVAALVAWLGWLLVRPFLHPQTHLVLLTGDIVSVDASPSAVPADYVVEDLRELLSLDSVLSPGVDSPPQPLILGSLRNPEEMDHLGQRLNEQLTGGSDAVLI